MNRITNIFALAAIGAMTFASCKMDEDHRRASSDDAKPMVAKQTIYASYGAPVNPNGETTPAGKLLGDVPAYEGKPVRVSGTVSKVCERKGCWLAMTDGGEELFVKFTCPVDGRLIPLDAVGKPAIVEGQLAVKEVSEADARHLAEEGGKTPEQVARIVGPQKQVTLKSPGAVVFGIAAK